ncbi:MAG: hypothetical protein RLZZ211_1420 [Bacteroidota bacterium]|jgi:hypothetical protein
MRQRLILLFLGLVALGWVIFSSYDLLSNENLVDFRHYFNAKDKTIYVVQDPKAIDWDNESIVSTSFNKDLYYSVLKYSNEPENLTFFFSATHTKILIEQKGNWTKDEVEALLQNGLFALQMGKLKQFRYGKLNGIFNRNQLLIYEGELPEAKSFDLRLSSKASYAWFTWNRQKNLQLTETYCKKEGRYRYVKYKNPDPAIRKLDDQALYADVIPDFFRNYYFYEKTYAKQLDPSFAKSPWFKCIDKGFVHLKQDSSSLVIFDFQENAHPIQTLNEFFRKEELNTETASYNNLQFSGLISTDKTTWHLAVFGQFGFASPSKALLDQALAAATLGQTLSQDEAKANRFYANMPSKVSARWVDPSQKKTITLLGKQIVEASYRKLDAQANQEQEKIRDYFVMNPGFRVLRFAAFSERGNVIALTENHQLVGYINGLRKWDKALTQEVRDLYQISGFSQLICVQFEHEAQLLDKTGRLVYRLSHDAGTRIQVMENKGKKEFICTNKANSIQLYNETGGLIKQISVDGKVRQMQSFKQGAKAYVSILTDKQHNIIDLNKRRVALKQNADSTYVLVGNPSGAFAVKVAQTTATILSLNGQKQFELPSRVVCVGAYMQADNHIIVFKRNKSLYAFTAKGQRTWEKTLDVVELSQLNCFYGPNQKSILSMIDAVGNQIILLDDLGRDLDTDKRHGEQEVQLSAFGNNAYSITTFLGNYIIQYNKQ